jgi:hypothetical protein
MIDFDVARLGDRRCVCAMERSISQIREIEREGERGIWRVENVYK